MNGGKLNKLADFRDSNIGTGGYMWLETVALSDTEFIVNIPGPDMGTSISSTLARLTKVNPEDVVDKTVITLMAQYMNGDIGNAIMKFNRSNDKYMIKMINYDTLYQDDWETARKQFNLDITSGKAADIICVSNNEASLRKYVDKGILLDLTPAFEKGGPLGDIEYLPNVAEMMKIDGKLYTFMPSFYVETCSTKTKFLNGKTTLSFKDWDDIITSNGANYDLAFGTYVSRENLGSYLWTYYGDKFVDWKNKKCNFNNPEFIEYLNFVNKFPDEEHQFEGEENGEWVPEEKFVQEDKTLFYRTYISSFDDYARTAQLTFKEDFEFVGFPNEGGENLAVISPSTFAVNSKTEHKEVIYDVIKSIMTADKEAFYGFSPVKSKFDEQFAKAIQEKSEDDIDAYGWDPVTDKEVKVKPLSQEQAQKSMSELKRMQEDINELMRKLVDKKEFDWQDKKDLQELAKKQQQVKEMLQQMQQQLNENKKLEQKYKDQSEKLMEKQRELDKLMNEVMNDEMKQMMQEIEKMMQELDKDKVQEQLEQLKLDNQELEKQLDQNIELMRRLEIEKRVEDAVQKTEQLANKQRELSERTQEAKSKDEKEKMLKEQQDLSNQFDQLRQELNQIQKDYKDIDKDLDFKLDQQLMDKIDQNQKGAENNLEKGKSKDASKQQKNASDQLDQLSEQIASSRIWPKMPR